MARRGGPTGFTIVEAAVSVAIVGVLLVASTGTFAGVARSRRAQVERRQAYMLAEQLMSEVLQQYFQAAGTGTAFGPAAGQTRATFADVDQYNGYVASPPTDQSGAALAGYAGWTYAVAVAYVDPATLSVTATATTLKQATVTVTAPSAKQYRLVAVRSQFGAYEQPPANQTTYVTGVGVTVQGPSPAQPVYTGGRPLNVTTSQ